MKAKFIIVTVVLTFVAGCSSKAQDGKVIAEVNGQKATQEYLLAQFPLEYRASLTAEDMERAIQSWVELEILYQEAVRQKIDEDRQVLDLIDQARKTIIARRFLESTIGLKVNVTDSEVIAAYQKESTRFTSNEEAVNLSHIVLRSEGAAQAIYKRLQAGENFAQLVEDYSEDTSTAKRGGDIGFLPIAALEKAMIDEITPLPIGKFTKPIKSQAGAYHIFLVKDRRASGTAIPFEEVRDDIAQAILAEKQQIAYDSLMANLKKNAKIKIYPIGDSLGKK